MTVWCDLWSGGIIGTFYFGNQDDATNVINRDTYCTMITDYIVPALHGIDVEDVWFQQNGATCHESQTAIDLLHQMFDGRLIIRNGDVYW